MSDICNICGGPIKDGGDIDYAWVTRSFGYDGSRHHDYQRTEWNFCGPCFDAHVKPAIESVITIIPPTTNEWGPQ